MAAEEKRACEWRSLTMPAHEHTAQAGVSETNAKLKALGIDWKKMLAKTAHGFGFTAYRKARPNVKVDENNVKVRDLIDQMLPPNSPLKVFSGEIAKLVSLAKQGMVGGPGGPVNDLHTWLEMADHYDVFDDEDGSQQRSARNWAVRSHCASTGRQAAS